MALDTLYTSPTYNGFISVLDMNDVMTDLGVLMKTSFWAPLSEASKEALIKASSRALSKLDWKGSPNPSIVVSDLTWPRIDIDGAEPTQIPYDLQLRMGCWIVHNAVASPLAAPAGNIASKSVGDVSVTYNTAGAGSISTSSSCDSYATAYLNTATHLGGLGTLGLRRNP